MSNKYIKSKYNSIRDMSFKGYGIELHPVKPFDLLSLRRWRNNPYIRHKMLDKGTNVFFASDEYVYAVETDGSNYGNWPMNIDEEVISSIVFASIDSYDLPFVLFGDDSGRAHIYTITGESYDNFPISYSFPFKGSPTILDTDFDGDLEFILGSTQTLTNIDIKEPGTVEGLWNTHRANMKRTGYYLSTVEPLSISDDTQNYEFSILNIYPNPFNPSVNIDYSMEVSDFVDLSKYKSCLPAGFTIGGKSAIGDMEDFLKWGLEKGWKSMTIQDYLD